MLKKFDEFNGVWVDIGYSVLKILISQSSTSDPTIEELYNDSEIGYTISRSGAGYYRIIFDAEILSAGKTFIMIQQNDDSLITASRTDTNEITIRTSDDGRLNLTSLELNVFN